MSCQYLLQASPMVAITPAHTTAPLTPRHTLLREEHSFPSTQPRHPNGYPLRGVGAAKQRLLRQQQQQTNNNNKHEQQQQITRTRTRTTGTTPRLPTAIQQTTQIIATSQITCQIAIRSAIVLLYFSAFYGSCALQMPGRLRGGLGEKVISHPVNRFLSGPAHLQQI